MKYKHTPSIDTGGNSQSFISSLKSFIESKVTRETKMASIEIFQSMWIIVPIFPARRSRTHIHIINIIVNESLLFSPLFLHMIYDCTLLDYQSPWLSFICIVLDSTHGRSSHLRKKKERERSKRMWSFYENSINFIPLSIYILLTTVFLLIQSRKINGFYLVSDISWDIMNV